MPRWTGTVPTTFVLFMLLALSSPQSADAKQPAFYHYYYVFKNSFKVCGDLVAEVFGNTDKNWKFPKSSLRPHAAAFSVGDVRGSLRCLSKSSNDSWVVIVVTGNNSGQTRDLFNELKVGVCGNC